MLAIFKDLKTYLFLILFILLVLLINNIILSNKMKNEMYQKTQNSLTKIFNEKLQAKKDVAISSSIILASNSNIKKALKNNDRNLAFKELESLDDIYRKYTKFKNVKIHIHTADFYSFLRVWDKNKYGDYLGDFRPAIVWVKNNKEPIVSIEVGRAGFVIRGISPILENNNYLGSIEFIQGLDSLVKDLLKENIYSLIIMKKEYLNIATSLRKNQIIDDYVVTLENEVYDKNFLDEIKNNINNFDKGYIITKNFFIIKIPLRDFESNLIGYAIVGEKIKQLNNSVY